MHLLSTVCFICFAVLIGQGKTTQDHLRFLSFLFHTQRHVFLTIKWTVVCQVNGRWTPKPPVKWPVVEAISRRLTRFSASWMPWKAKNVVTSPYGRRPYLNRPHWTSSSASISRRPPNIQHIHHPQNHQNLREQSFVNQDEDKADFWPPFLIDYVKDTNELPKMFHLEKVTRITRPSDERRHSDRDENFNNPCPDLENLTECRYLRHQPEEYGEQIQGYRVHSILTERRKNPSIRNHHQIIWSPQSNPSNFKFQ